MLSGGPARGSSIRESAVGGNVRSTTSVAEVYAVLPMWDSCGMEPRVTEAYSQAIRVLSC